MKRFVLVAIVALGLVLVSSKPAQAHGVWGFTPGHIGISGSANLSWGAFGFGKLSPAPYGYAPDYGYGHGYGVAPAAPAAPMYYPQPPIYYNYTPAYGYGYYPGCCGQ